MKINVAIDGPSAAGKSTIATALASKLNYVHLDTGAMYRSVAYLATINNISYEDEEKLAELIEKTTFKMMPNGDIILNDELVNDKIRTNEMSMGASAVSKHPLVRKALVAMQQKIAEDKGYILDGRDIGTVVLKDAEVKIFMTASAEARARRRVIQNEEKGLPADYEMILEDINKRDYQDTHRETSPLRKADDAIELDTSDLSKDEVIDMMYKIVKEKIK